MMDRKQKRELLEGVIDKQINLKKTSEEWDRDILSEYPPILWFGNSRGDGPSVVTVAANPSHKEYLGESRSDLEDVESSNEHSGLRSLDEKRLHVPDQPLESLDHGQIESILNGYDRYFRKNPYTTWFGKDEENSYSVEGFLRGFDASFYEDDPKKRAVHIDLFPFVTLQGFSDIENRAETDLFQSGTEVGKWAPTLFRKLVSFLDPDVLLVFGEKNCYYFEKHFGGVFDDTSWTSCDDQPACYKVGSLEWIGRPVIGLGTNLGNPIGFDKQSLRRYGDCVGSVYNNL